MDPELLINTWAAALVAQFPDWPGRSLIDAQTDEVFNACLVFQKQDNEADHGGNHEDMYFQAFTLSQASLEAPGSRKELFLRVTSAHEAWFESLLHLLQDLGGQEIVPGMMVKFNAAIAPDTELNAWVIGFNPWQLPLQNGFSIEYIQAYPIFAGEIELLAGIGFAKFAERLGDELYNPYRQSVKI